MSRGTPWRTSRQMYALHQPGHNDWYRIRNQAGGPTQLHIYNEIGYFGVTANDLVRDLADVNGPIDVHINSPGGEVWEGITIYNSLLSRNDVTVYIDGLAASIASVIAMAGNPVLISRNGEMMMHEGHTMAIGSADDLRDLIERLESASNNIASIYSDHTGKPVSYWRELMKAETWFDGQSAIDAGLADRFIPAGTRQTRDISDHRETFDLVGVYRNAVHDAASRPYVSERQTRHEPMTGRHAHDHAAFEADDHDDGQHIHMHEHTGDALHNHEHPAEGDHAPGVGGRDGVGGRTMEDYAEDLTLWNWDGAAAMRSAHSAADFRKICAGERSTGDPDTAAHWALPHHTSPSSGPDKGGVTAALGRWNQTQGLKNKQAALAHLKAHARSLGLPSGGDDGDIAELDLSDEDVQKFISGIQL